MPRQGSGSSGGTSSTGRSTVQVPLDSPAVLSGLKHDAVTDRSPGAGQQTGLYSPYRHRFSRSGSHCLKKSSTSAEQQIICHSPDDMMADHDQAGIECQPRCSCAPSVRAKSRPERLCSQSSTMSRGEVGNSPPPDLDILGSPGKAGHKLCARSGPRYRYLIRSRGRPRRRALG